MPRRVLLVTAAVLSSLLPPGVARSNGVWNGEPSMIGGTSRYHAGEWIHTDFVYDDYGADTLPAGQSQVVSLAPTAGDFRYPNGTTAAGNAADIVEVRARISAANPDDLEVRVRLQSLVDPATPAIWVDTGAVETVFTSLNASVDANDNTIAFTLPGAATGTTLSLNVGAGLHDGAGGLRAGVPGTASSRPGDFTTGGPSEARLFDLAFNTTALEGRGGAWNENLQSRRLADGDVASFAQTIDITALAGGATTPLPAGTGYFVRQFESRQELGEGMGPSFPQYRGRRQPYAIWIPSSYQQGTPVPLFLNLHSLSVHHNQYRGGPAAGASYATMYEQFETAIGAIVVTPLGRGPDGWYEDAALVDTLEVWADVLDNYTIDPDRVFVGGYSMGGYGTYRLTTMMPDAFAAAVSVVGPPANGIWAYPLTPTGGEANPDNTNPQLESTRHVPFWITHGVEDELVPFTGVAVQAQRLASLGHEYRFALHPVADHFFFAFRDEWSREAGWLAGHPTRVVAPHRVTLDIRPASWATGDDPTILAHLASLTDEIGTRLDGGYWVRDVVVTPGTDRTGFVNLRSGGIAVRQTGHSPVTAPGLDGPSPYVLTGQDKAWTTGSLDDVLSGSLGNVESLTIDVGLAGLPDQPELDVNSPTPVSITFVRNGQVVGSSVILSPQAGSTP